MTILTDKFLIDELDERLNVQNTEKVYKNYYRIMIDTIARVNVFLPTATEVEDIITNGSTDRISLFYSPIETMEERENLFLLATAKQLMFDKSNGRASLIRGENDMSGICPDTYILLKELGFVQAYRY